MSENIVDVNVDGQTFEVTLDTTSIVVGGGGVTSWNGRTLTVVPEYGDYLTSLIENDSGVSGITLSDALDTINGQLLNPNNFINQFTTNDQQVSGRLSIITPLITNVSDAVDVQFLLDNVVFNGDLPSSFVESVYGRNGVVVAETGDYSGTQITNDSGVSGANISDALDNINSQLVNPNNFVNQFTTNAQQVSGRLSIITPTLANVLDAVNVEFLNDNVVFNGDLNAINISTFINDVPYLTANDLPSNPVISVAGKTGIVTLFKSDISDFNESDYATAAQGALADSALQFGDNNSSLNNDSLYITLADIPSAPVLSVNNQVGAVILNQGDIGLSNVDNTSDADKPISTATQTALNNKLSSGDNVSELVNDASYITIVDVPAAPVDSVNGQTGVVTITKTSVGLSNVDNTSDLDKPVSNATQTALDSKLESGDNVSELANDAGYITANDLPSGGLTYKGTWDADQNIPDLSSLTPDNGDFYEVSVAGNTPLGGETDWKVKDWAIYSDTLGWDKLDNTSDVTSVNGQTGAVVLDKSDVGLGNVDNTSDLAKPISNATQTALDSKLENGDGISELNNDVGYITLGDVPTDAVTSVNGQVGIVVLDKNDIGLGNVDNTSDLNKPISNLAQTALDAKLESGDNVSELVNDAGYITSGDIPSDLVTSVNGQQGVVVLDADDIDDSTTTNKFVDQALLNKVAGIDAGAQVNTVDSVNGQTGTVSLGKSDVGLSNVDNTSDLDKPVSNATQDELDLKGDMFKATYDTDDDGIVDKAESVVFKAELNQSVVKGNLLYGVGRNPTTGTPIAGLADNTVFFADKTVGMALTSGSSGSVIEVVKIGVIEDIDTSSFNLGETVYLSTFGTFDSKNNITAGVFNPVGYVVKSAFVDGSLIIDTTTTESITTDNTINESTVAGRTVTEALDNLASGSGGVQSVTGDGVNNLDPLNPVLSFPGADEIDDSTTTSKFATQLQLDAISTNTQEINLNDNKITVLANSKLDGVTGDGVDNSDPVNPVLSFPNPNDIGLGNVDNTSDLDKPVSNAVQAELTILSTELLDKVDKPSGSSFEQDILRRSNTSGEFEYYTPVGGSVKINGMLQNVTVIQDGNVDIDFSGNTQSFSSTVNQFPRNIANQFPTQDPVNDPNTFYPLIFDTTTGRWLENPIDGQVHFWRITANFTRSTTAGNRQMRFILTNPDTGFEQDYAQEIRRVNTPQTITANILTVADAGSIGAGYVLNIDLDNQNQTTGNTTFLSVDVTRLSLEKI